MNKIINSRCICNNGLPWIKKEVIMLYPCEHLIHLKCFNKKKTTNCPYCNKSITKLIRHDDFKYDKTLYQQCIDIISMSNFDGMSSINTNEFLMNLPNLISTVAQIPFTKGIKGGKELIKNIFSLNNIKINVKGLNKLKSGPKVFIANHTSHLDFLTIFYVLQTGFLASSVIRDNFVSNQLLNIIQILVIDRGNNKNTVEQMRQYVEQKGSICLFPEGMMTNPNTLINFRTGAFYIGYPVYPIILKYKKVVSDMSTSNFILKISSCQTETIEMSIMNPFYPPFDETKIENIRNKMAEKGNFVLSRVSNKDIKDQ